MMDKRMLLMICMVGMLIASASSSARGVDLLTSALMFESGGEYNIEMNGTEDVSIDVIGFHQYSSTWYLFFRANSNDVAPYDNLSITLSCNEQSPVTFYTNFYEEWNDSGELTFSYDYYETDVALPYNSHIVYGDISHCDISVDSISYVGNGGYNYITVETIPLISVLEDFSCDRVDSMVMDTADSMTSFFGWMGDMWEIAWYVYSIGLIVVAIFVIPIMVFILFRYALYKLMGYKLVERRA